MRVSVFLVQKKNSHTFELYIFYLDKTIKKCFCNGEDFNFTYKKMKFVAYLCIQFDQIHSFLHL